MTRPAPLAVAAAAAGALAFGEVPVSIVRTIAHARGVAFRRSSEAKYVVTEPKCLAGGWELGCWVSDIRSTAA